MSDNQSKGIVPQKGGNWLSKISDLAKRGLQVTQKIDANDSLIKKQLKEINEFYSIPTSSDGISNDGDFEAHRIVSYYVGGPFAQTSKWITFVSSNASTILFPLDDPIESIAAKMIWDNTQKAYKQYNIANRLDDQGLYKEAESLYWESLKIYPTPEAFVNLAHIFLIQERYRDVELVCHRAIKTTRVTMTDGTVYADEFDIFAIAYSNLGLALHNLEKFEAAKVALRKSIAINPNVAMAHFNLGSLLENQNRLQESENEYRQAIAINSSFAGAYFNLGVILAKQNRIQEANKMTGKALQLDPSLKRYLG